MAPNRRGTRRRDAGYPGYRASYPASPKRGRTRTPCARIHNGVIRRQPATSQCRRGRAAIRQSQVIRHSRDNAWQGCGLNYVRPHKRITVLSKVYNHFIRPRLHFTFAAAKARLSGLVAFKVLASNMEPTITLGEAGLVKPFRNPASEAALGQVVAYRSERHSGVIIPSRAIALAGQSVEIRDGDLLVDNTRVPEPYLDPRRAEQDYSRTVPKTSVPEGAVYLLGDFRDMSEDSRAIGAVPLRCIVGQVVLAIPLKPDSSSRKVR